jgi:hypothetical protein
MFQWFKRKKKKTVVVFTWRKREMAISFPNGSYFSVEHCRESVRNIIMASPVQEIDIYTLIKEINYNHVHGSNDACIHEWKLHTQRAKLTFILVKNSISVPSLQTLVSFKTSNSTILMFLVNILLRYRSVEWRGEKALESAFWTRIRIKMCEDLAHSLQQYWNNCCCNNEAIPFEQGTCITTLQLRFLPSNMIILQKMQFGDSAIAFPAHAME